MLFLIGLNAKYNKLELKKILGISAFYHDSAAAIIVDGKIIAAAQEERFTRDKHTPDFPIESIKYCLEESGFSIDELDAVVFYDKPLLKFERLLQTYYSFAPKGLLSFLKAIPVWIKDKLFLKKLIYDGLKKVQTYSKKDLTLLFSEHHLSHAASSFFTSSFDRAAILTLDGVGEWSTASIGIGDKNSIRILEEMHFPHSLGLLYSAFTYYLGFKVNSGEYKLMGLAPYGNSSDPQTIEFIEKIKENLISIKADGSLWMNQSYFRYATGLRMTNNKKWEQLLGISKRSEDESLEQCHCNLALAIQKVTEEVVLKMAIHAKELTQASTLCLAGGVALNCVANGELLRAGIFDEIYIQPAAGDAGGALGAALAVYYMYFEKERGLPKSDSMNGAYLGPAFTNKEVELMNRRVKAVAHFHMEEKKLLETTADLLSKYNVVGWFQGRMEFGPRALGNRSILGSAQSDEMQKTINLKIKYREGYRPFAPLVLKEDAQSYFDLDVESPYMLLVAPLQKELCAELPKNYYDLSIMDRLHIKRSAFQAITHVDFSARIQTVSNERNAKLTSLLLAYKERTGTSVMVNTSFNVRGEPIVCTPYDAYRCFMSTEMDVLVINNFIYLKEEQPNWMDKTQWEINFKLD